MSQQPIDHPWQGSVVHGGTRHSAEFIAAVIASVAHASSSEIATAMGVTRNVVVGIVDRARRAGVEIVRKHGRTPCQVAIVKPAPVAKAPLTGARVPKTVLRIVPTSMPAVTFNTGVSILDVRAYQCRALDDAGDCCCQPVAGGSWCAGHRAIYLRTSIRRAA